MRRALSVLLFTTIAVASLLAIAAHATTPRHTDAKFVFKVRSSIDSKSVFGHRVHWVAHPNLAATKILAVEFLIDGKLRWIEHHPSYTYGGLDGDNYLVTSWLTPGRHRFEVIAFGPQGAKATDTVSARVLPSPDPPAELAGVWTTTHAANATGTTPGGTWTLTVDKVGWRITDPARGGNLIDAFYGTPGSLVLRTGIWMHPHNTNEGNGWCEDTNLPVSFNWSVSGNTLTLAHIGTDGCGESDILDGDWTRVQ